MKLFCMLILIFLIPVGLNGQTSCLDFNNYASSQVWIKAIIKLDKETQKDSALQRIKCERIIGEQNVKFSLICIIDGLIAYKIPDYRDSLLKRIDSQNMELIGSLCEMTGVYPRRCELGMLLISKLEKPVIKNISYLRIKEIERKKGTISITVKSLKSNDFDIIIEDFCDTENCKTIKKHLKKGTNKIKFSVDNELKLITILGDEKKLIMIK
jgi:hypothetical protein